MFRQRLRLWFRVEGDKRYLSHHDTMRLWTRALRRAELPLRLTQGYNPRPRISLPEPRRVGIASTAEILEFELADWVGPDAILRRLRDALPQGLVPEAIELVRPNEKARPAAVVYEATLDLPPDVDQQVRRLLDASELPVVRHRPKGDKHLDARPFIESVDSLGDGRLRMTLKTGPSGTVRPDEVLGLLGCDAEDVDRADLVRTEIRLD